MGTTERKEKVRAMRKEDIVEAAERVIFRKGLENTTMDDVAAEAEYSKRTLYIYFTTKEQLYHAIIARGYRTLNEMITQSLQQDNLKTGFEKIQKIGVTYIEFIKGHPNYFTMIINYSDWRPDDITNASRIDSYSEGEKLIEIMTKFIQEGITDGSIRENIDPVSTQFVLYSAMIGIGNLILYKETYIQNMYSRTTNDIVQELFKLMSFMLKP